jgi:hypothetical protein
MCVPLPEKRLQRAAARLLGINSRRGLIAGAMRMAAKRVDAEAGVRADGDEDSDSEADAASGTLANLFMYSQRKQRSNFEAGAEIRAKACEWWDARTRVSSCRRIVVKLADGKSHPVHWLEQTINSFRHSFLDKGDHYYKNQLLIRHVPPNTSVRPCSNGDHRTSMQGKRTNISTWSSLSTLTVMLRCALRSRHVSALMWVQLVSRDGR